MKTKTVELYVDLHEGWQNVAENLIFLAAYSNPTQNPIPAHGYKRVKITVDLPCVPFKFDCEVKGKAE